MKKSPFFRKDENDLLADGEATDGMKCIVCSETDIQLLAPSVGEQNRLGIKRNLFLCNTCGLIFKYPAVPDQAAVRHWKEIYKSNQYDSDWMHIEKLYHPRYQAISDAAAQTLREKGLVVRKMLDVGTETGYFLKVFADTYRASLGDSDVPLQLHGIDPGYHAIEYGRRHHKELSLNAGRFEDVELPHGEYDLISFINVVYRFHDLPRIFEASKEALKPGGKLLVVIDFYFKDYAVQEERKANYVNLYGWFDTAQYLEYYFCKPNFEYLISRFCHIERCVELDGNYGYVYILTPREQGARSDTGLDASVVKYVKQYLAQYSEKLSAIKLREFFQSREVKNIVIVTSDASGRDLADYCRKHLANISVVDVVHYNGSAGALKKNMKAFAEEKIDPSSTAILVSSVNRTVEILRILKDPDIRCYTTLPPYASWPYESRLDDDTRIVWYTHIPAALPPAYFRQRRLVTYLPRFVRGAGRKVLRRQFR